MTDYSISREFCFDFQIHSEFETKSDIFLCISYEFSDVLSKEWTAFVQRAQAHTDPRDKPLALAFSATINPLVHAYATKNVKELTRIFSSYLENGTRLLPHIQNPKMHKAMEKILAKDKKLLQSKPVDGPAGVKKIDRFVAQIHKIVMKTVNI